MLRDPKFDALRQAADPAVASALERLVATGAEDELSRIDAIRLAEKLSLPEERVIDALIHASRLGIFEMSWNLLCPGCGGVLDENKSLGHLQEEYACALCAASYEPTLDEMVEVAFTVSPGVRRIAAHNPESLDYWDYYRLVYFSNGLDVPPRSELMALSEQFVIEGDDIPAHGKLIFSTQLPREFVILFEPVTHNATFIDVKGEPTTQRRELQIIFDERGRATEKLEMAPGPIRIVMENRTGQRLLPMLTIASDPLHDLLSKRRSFLTAKRVFTNQTFRDVYRASTLEVDQRLKISSLTVLFTDLKGSTELYERVGDLTAYDLVRAHFKVLGDVIRAESGAVVKTIGDAVMATFPDPCNGLNAALHMRDAMDRLNEQRGSEDLVVKIGLHEGPCLAVTSNERLDYFGQTVNIAARVQALADSRSIFATESIIGHPSASAVLAERGLTATTRRASLRGIAEELTVYEIA